VVKKKKRKKTKNEKQKTRKNDLNWQKIEKAISYE